METLTKEGLNRWLEKGISNVAFVSLALGLENEASNAFIQEKVRLLVRSTDPLVQRIMIVLVEQMFKAESEFLSRSQFILLVHNY